MNKETNLKNLLVMMVLVLGVHCSIAGGDTIYVDADAGGANNGSSWTDAYNYLQDALGDPNLVSGNQIWVAKGTYRPDEDTTYPSGTDDRTAAFQLINGVAVYGGFPSGGGTWNDRDPKIYKTVLSGDLDGNDVGGLNDPSRNENSYHVVTGSGTDANAVLDGFTITAGKANGGAGPYNNGGGMYNDSGSPTVTNCSFIGNKAATYAGGMYNINTNSGPTLTGCTFSGNTASYGAGIFDSNSSPTITTCTFSGNVAVNKGGGMLNSYSAPILTNCMFIGNSATHTTGGAMANWESNPMLTNCSFTGNSTGGWGGGMHNDSSSSPTVTNCTFSGNSADYGGGICNQNSSSPTLANCIIWGNTAPNMPQIYKDGTCFLTVSYCDVQGGWPGTDNIDADPNFVDPNNLDPNERDYHLLPGSPCIDTGDPCGDYSGQTDIDGEPRVYNGWVDIGADELFPPIHNVTQDTYYFTIQDAIDAAVNGDIIAVKKGTYTGTDNRDLDFGGKAITVRSSDPNDPNVVAATIIDCQGDPNELHRGFYFHTGEEANSVVAGFTITNGLADYGGAIQCSESSPTIRNCTITNNTANNQGGGLYLNNASPTIADGTMISNNNPEGVWIDAASTLLITGTVHIVSNNLVGDGAVQIDPNASLNMDDAEILCNVSGVGTIEVDLGAELIVDGNAVIDLGDPCDPNVRGTLDCKGTLRVKDNGQITNARINITKATFEDNAYISNSEIYVDSNAPYGQVFAEPNTSFVDVNIYADGDRYMDMDPSVFDGNFVNVRIFVTITEGVGKPFGGLFECRGEDGLTDVNSCDPNNVFFCRADPGTIPDCNLSTWTLEKLELVAGAKLNLTNRFPFQPPYDQDIDYNDVVYVKELILRHGSVLNLSFNKLYYETLIVEPNVIIKNMPLLGFSVINIALDDQTEFIVRVTHNNYTDPNNQNYNRVHIERVTGLSPDPNGMMRMSTLKDEDPCSPTYQQDVNACAKGTFAKTSESEDVAIEFEYMFTADPCGDAELAVYLSDDPELGQNLWEVARLRPPASGRPGSIGSDRFVVFSGLFPAEGFYFIRGTYIELRLLGSANASCLINNWDPRVNCIGICGDFNIEEPFPLNIVDIYDYLVLLAEFGLCNPGGAGKGCLDLIGDGCVNNDDILAWGTDELLHACGGGALAASTSLTGKALLTVPASENQGASETEPLLICGKPTNGIGNEVPGSYLYNVNTSGVCTSDPNQTDSDGRLVTDSNGNIYQINGYLGLVSLDTQTAVIEPNVIAYGGSSVLVGYNSGEGLLLSDAVFKLGDPNIVYIVPVQVDPQDGNCPYMAAAKLQLTGGGNYNLLQLYGKNPATDPCQSNTLVDCDGDLLYEPDVQHLHEIEIDSEGNLFVLSSDWFNENNWLLVYDEAIGNSSEVRLSLSDANIAGPTAMVVSSFSDKLYLASSSGGPNDLITEVCRFSIDKTIPGEPSLIFDNIVEVNCPEPNICNSYPSVCDAELGYVSMITSMIENPGDGTLYVTGFTAPKFPDDAVMSSPPYNQLDGIFTTSMLAVVESGANGMIEAVDIINSDLVLPFSLVWTGAVITQEKCGGADLDDSNDVDFADFAILAYYWLETDCGSFNDCDGADLEPEDVPDGDVDMLDLAVLAGHWLDTGCLN